MYSVKVKICFLATSFFVCASALSCISSTDAYINTKEYPPIKHNIGKEVHQKEKFPQPYASMIEAEIEKVPWFGTRHTGSCGTGMWAGRQKFTEILQKAPVNKVFPFLDHPAQYVREAAHIVIEKRRKLYKNQIKKAYENGSSRIKLELMRYVEPNAPDEKKYELLNQIIHNPKLRIYFTDVSYFQDTEAYKGRYVLNQHKPENYPIDIIGFYVRLLEDHFNQDRAFALRAIATFGTHAERAIPALIKVLEIDDVSGIKSDWSGYSPHTQRTLAAIALGNIGIKDPRAIELLCEMKTDWRNDIACQAASALYRMGEQKEEQFDFILEKLNGKNTNGEYCGIAESLGLLGKDAIEAVPMLEKLIAHKDYLVRCETGRMLEKIEGEEKTLQRYIRNVHHENPDAREDAIRYLGRHFNKPGIRDILFEALKDSNPDVIYAACDILQDRGKVPSEKLLPGWIRILELGGNNSSASQAVYSIKEMGNKANEALPALLNFLGSKQETYIDSTIESIRAVGGDCDCIVDRLIRVLADDELYVRRAIHTLSELKCDTVRAIPALFNEYQNPPPHFYDGGNFSEKDIQRACSSAIRSILYKVDKDSELPVDCLLKIMLLNDKYLSDSAFTALKNFGSCNGLIVDNLVRQLDNEDEDVRELVIGKLGEMGESTFHVIPLLKKITDDENAEYAISKIISSLPVGNEYNHDILMMSIERDGGVKEWLIDTVLDLGLPEEVLIMKLAEMSGGDYEISNSISVLTKFEDKAVIALPVLRSQYKYQVDGRLYQDQAHNIARIIKSTKPDSNISVEDLISMMDCDFDPIIDASIQAVLTKGGSYDDIAVKLANNALTENEYLSSTAEKKLLEHKANCISAIPILNQYRYTRKNVENLKNVDFIIDELILCIKADSSISVSDIIPQLEVKRQSHILNAADAIARITGSYDIACEKLVELASSEDEKIAKTATWVLKHIAGNAKAVLTKLKEIKPLSEAHEKCLNMAIETIETGEIRPIEIVMQERWKIPIE